MWIFTEHKPELSHIVYLEYLDYKELERQGLYEPLKVQTSSMYDFSVGKNSHIYILMLSHWLLLG